MQRLFEVSRPLQLSLAPVQTSYLIGKGKYTTHTASSHIVFVDAVREVSSSHEDEVRLCLAITSYLFNLFSSLSAAQWQNKM